MKIKTGKEVVGRYDENWKPRYSEKKRCNEEKWISLEDVQKARQELIKRFNLHSECDKSRCITCINQEYYKQIINKVLGEKEVK